MSHKILVIDDDELVRTGLASNLQRAGFQVSTAESGAQALALLDDAPADLVLCDLVLEGMDGMEILRRIQAGWPEILVVMITGHGTIGSALEALRNGASDYLQKPANPDEVVHRIRSVLDAAALKRALTSEKQKAESRKKELSEHLIRAERMVSLGLLAEGAARDLQLIISPVERCHDRILEVLPADNPAVPYIQNLQEACQKVTAVIKDLQSIGRSGQYEKGQVDLNRIVQEVVAGASAAPPAPRPRIELHLARHLPEMLGSADQLRQVVLNLLLNAVEAAGPSGVVSVSSASEHLVHPSGRYGSGKPGDYAVLRVKDNGPGLSVEDVERFFEPFYIHARMNRKLVSGLAMALVYRFVEDHQGYIDLVTGPGRGAIFSVYLPLQRKPEDEILELRPDYTGGETILVVDDYELHRNAAADMLRGMGYHVFTAESGQQAVRMFESNLHDATARKIDLVVIDLVLADAFDGVETYKKIIELKQDQKAIMVSGFADIARIVEARTLGVRQCIQKPYETEALGKAVRRELDG